jgi:hypothetical protein
MDFGRLGLFLRQKTTMAATITMTITMIAINPITRMVLSLELLFKKLFAVEVECVGCG